MNAMPAKSISQLRAARLELGRREAGLKKEKKATRPFGSASMEDLEEFAKKPKVDLPFKTPGESVIIVSPHD